MFHVVIQIWVMLKFWYGTIQTQLHSLLEE